MLYIFETHPVQYHAPVWRKAAQLGVPLKVFYGGDFSVKGYHDKEFNASYSWDTDLLHGYDHQFLCDLSVRKPKDYDSVTGDGIETVIKNGKVDAVLLLGYSHGFDRAAIRNALKYNIPIIYRGEANDTAIKRSFMRSSVRHFYLRSLYRRMDRFLFIGQEARRHYNKHGVKDNHLIFSPYCVDASTFKASEEDRGTLRNRVREELSIKQDEKVILYSGKLSHRKGVDLLLEAASRCSAELTVLYVGDGELRTELESRSLDGVRALFTGFQNQLQLSRFYHAADLLALPSRHSETWGLVVNEALAHGLPVVVSDAVGCRWDLVKGGETGEITRRDDVGALTEALSRCLKYAGSLQTRQRCREIVRPYSVDNAAMGVLNAYHSIVSDA